MSGGAGKAIPFDPAGLARLNEALGAEIRVTNLGQFSRALKKLDKEMQAELASELRAMGEPIAAAIRGKVPRKSGRAAGSVKVRANMKGAAIAAGGARAPYFQWLDFGGSVGRGHVQGQAWSGAIRRMWTGKPNGMGRYVYPTISEHKGDTKKAMGKAIAKAGRAAGFEVR